MNPHWWPLYQKQNISLRSQFILHPEKSFFRFSRSELSFLQFSEDGVSIILLSKHTPQKFSPNPQTSSTESRIESQDIFNIGKKIRQIIMITTTTKSTATSCNPSWWVYLRVNYSKKTTIKWYSPWARATIANESSRIAMRHPNFAIFAYRVTWII